MRLVRELRKQGFDVERTGSGHWKASNPDRGGAFVIFAFSPKGRALHKTIRRLEEIGFRS